LDLGGVCDRENASDLGQLRLILRKLWAPV
jgi:hypothetical protein